MYTYIYIYIFTHANTWGSLGLFVGDRRRHLPAWAGVGFAVRHAGRAGAREAGREGRRNILRLVEGLIER